MLTVFRFCVLAVILLVIAVSLSPATCYAGEVDLELDGDAIKRELAFGGSQLMVSNRTCSVDTLTAALRARYYFNSRYHNPGVPFTFVPYNYRASYV